MSEDEVDKDRVDRARWRQDECMATDVKKADESTNARPDE